MTDTFEAHLIVRPADEPALFAYCLDLDAKKQAQLKIHMPKPSRAVSFYGDCPQQPMLTFWYYSDFLMLALFIAVIVFVVLV